MKILLSFYITFYLFWQFIGLSSTSFNHTVYYLDLNILNILDTFNML